MVDWHLADIVVLGELGSMIREHTLHHSLYVVHSIYFTAKTAVPIIEVRLINCVDIVPLHAAGRHSMLSLSCLQQHLSFTTGQGSHWSDLIILVSWNLHCCAGSKDHKYSLLPWKM